jgi:acyl dehydratase
MPTELVFDSPADLHARIGQDLVTTDWVVMDQARIQLFADATGDQQWIHTDPERARRESPFGAPIAHGFLTLSMMAEFLQSSLHCKGIRMGVNYGLNKVRFPAPVPAGSRIRCHVHLLNVEDLDAHSAQQTWRATIEIEGVDKPACIAELVSRWYY